MLHKNAPAKKTAAKTPVKEEVKQEATSEQTEATAREAKPRGPKGVADTAKVTLLVSANPKREGSKAHTRFALYKQEQTVAEALDAGITTPDLIWDAKHGHISIEGHNPGEIVTPKPKAEPKEKKEPKGKKVEESAETKAAKAKVEEETQEEVME